MILRHLRHSVSRALVLAASLIALTVSAGAQTVPGGLPAPDSLKTIQVQSVPTLRSDAREVREQLMGVFQQYPPSVRAVFQLDPALLTNANYLAMYPVLATYLAQHPEVAHNPAYFIGVPNNYNGFGNYGDGREDSIGRSMSYVIEPLAVATVVIVAIYLLSWIIRAIINHRRWLRASKLQTEMQHKLLERFTSNEEMLAFIQTSAGQRFLESASMPAESGPRVLSAPVGRMLWSMQLGIVILVAGIGLQLVSYKLAEAELVTGFQVAGGIIVALGIGFILSAIGSYLLSRRLGLMDPAPSPSLK